MPAIKYIDSLEGKQHILLFYEEPEYAKLIEFGFIRNGLMKGEQCVYATDEDSGDIVVKMLRYGISLKYFLNGMLRVLQISNSDGSADEVWERAKTEVARVLSGLKPPSV